MFYGITFVTLSLNQNFFFFLVFMLFMWASSQEADDDVESEDGDVGPMCTEVDADF